MQISSRFTIALHMITLMETSRDTKVTSQFMADSIGVNAVIIRRILGQLKDAGLVFVKRGSGGAKLARPLDQVTFLDIYRAVASVTGRSLFHFHEQSNPKCSVGKNIHQLLDYRLDQAQQALEHQLKQQTLADLIGDAKRILKQ